MVFKQIDLFDVAHGLSGSHAAILLQNVKYVIFRSALGSYVHSPRGGDVHSPGGAMYIALGAMYIALGGDVT